MRLSIIFFTKDLANLVHCDALKIVLIDPLIIGLVSNKKDDGEAPTVSILR